MQLSAGWVTVAGRPLPVRPRLVASLLIAEVRSYPRALKLWLAFLLGVLGLAGITSIIGVVPGLEVRGTTPTVEWGWLIVGYVFFAIMTSGLCLSASLGTVFGIERFKPLEKRHLVLAILSLTGAFWIIAIDLHYPVRMVFGAVLVPTPSSPMWWMGVFYGGYLVFLLVELWATWFHKHRVHQVAAILTSCTAVAAPTTLGVVFAVLYAKPFWYGAFTPLLMISSALVAGTSLMGIAFAVVVLLRLRDADRVAALAVPAMRLLVVLAILLVSVVLAQHIGAALLSTTLGLRDAALALVAGPLALQFWGLRVLLGLVVPLVILLLPVGRSAVGLLVAGCFALPGVLVDRFTFVAGGQVVPITTISGTVSDPYAPYTPTLVEIGIVAGAAALIALGYTLAERYLDMSETGSHAPIPLAKIAARLRRPAPALVPVDAGEAAIVAEPLPLPVPASPPDPGWAAPDPEAGPAPAGMAPAGMVDEQSTADADALAEQASPNDSGRSAD